MENSDRVRDIRTDVPVLIVGGSLVGLASALFLKWHGVDALTIERHASTAIHPRAGHFHLRTLELFRQVGLEQAVIDASVHQFGSGGGIGAVESLAGRQIASYISDLNEGVEDVSPSRRLFLSQQRLEPLMRARAEDIGASLRYGAELVSFEEDATGITARIRDLASSEEHIVRTRYLIAADGNRSPIRERLAIEMSGPGHLSNSLTIYFNADIRPYLRDRDLGVIYVFNDDLRGFFRLEKDGTSGFLVVATLGNSAATHGRDVAADVSPERCAALLRSAIGDPDLPLDILHVAAWQAEAKTADRYRAGRVFLVGDAAHVMPPAGGFGGNTGIQDAQNIAWKLAAVLKGQAPPDLLDTYEAERRPVGLLTVEQAYTRWIRRLDPELGLASAPLPIDDMAMEIGYRYRVSADGNPATSTAICRDPRETPSLRGSRAPHVKLASNGRQLSSLDLLGSSFVMFVADEGALWIPAAEAAAEDLCLPLAIHHLRRDGPLVDVDDRFPATFGVDRTGAALIRPDGVLAWSSEPSTVPSRQTVLAALTAAIRGPDAATGPVLRHGSGARHSV